MSRLAPQGVNVKAAHERYPRNYEVSKWMRPCGNLDDCSPTHPIPCYAHGWCLFVLSLGFLSLLSSDFVYISLLYISSSSSSSSFSLSLRWHRRAPPIWACFYVAFG